MPTNQNAPENIPVNPLELLRRDILALQERERIRIRRVQVPYARAMDLLGMNAEQWRIGSNGFLTENEIDNIVSSGFTQGVFPFNRLTFGTIQITVAPNTENNCDDLTILEGDPME